MPMKKRRMSRVVIGSRSDNKQECTSIENTDSNSVRNENPISGSGVSDEEKKKIIKEIAKCLNTLRPPNPNKTYKKKSSSSSSNVKIGQGIENLL